MATSRADEVNELLDLRAEIVCHITRTDEMNVVHLSRCVVYNDLLVADVKHHSRLWLSVDVWLVRSHSGAALWDTCTPPTVYIGQGCCVTPAQASVDDARSLGLMAAIKNGSQESRHPQPPPVISSKKPSINKQRINSLVLMYGTPGLWRKSVTGFTIIDVAALM